MGGNSIPSEHAYIVKFSIGICLNTNLCCVSASELPDCNISLIVFSYFSLSKREKEGGNYYAMLYVLHH